MRMGCVVVGDQCVCVCDTQAVVAMKRVGVLHRDIKPGNVLVTADGVKVIDFDVAIRVKEGGHTSFCGTDRWIAPEVDAHRHSGRDAPPYSYPVDVWGAGVTLKHWLDPEVGGVYARAEELLGRMCEKDPSKRVSAEEALGTVEAMCRAVGPPVGSVGEE